LAPITFIGNDHEWRLAGAGAEARTGLMSGMKRNIGRTSGPGHWLASATPEEHPARTSCASVHNQTSNASGASGFIINALQNETNVMMPRP